MGSLFRKSEEQFCEEGLRYLQNGQFRYAETAFDRGLKAYPKSFSLLVNRSSLGIATQRYQQAADDLGHAIKNLPRGSVDGWTLYLNRATCYVRLEKNSLANKDFEKAFAEAPMDADSVLLGKGYFYRAVMAMESEPAKAMKDAKRALELDPSNQQCRRLVSDLQIANMSAEAMALGQRGAEMLQAGRLQEALESLEELVRLEPKSAKAWQLLGAALHKLERYPEELTALDRSVEIDGNEVALFNRAICHVALERYEQARTDLVAFLKISTHEETRRQAQDLLGAVSA